MEMTDQTERVVVRPPDHGRALLNPGMGWNFAYYTDNDDRRYGGDLADDDHLQWFPGCNSVDFRTGWGRIEPEEGRFNWEYTDRVAERWVAEGRQVSYCWIVLSTAGSVQPAPDWLRRAGAEGWTMQRRRRFWCPNWDDPVFLEKLDRFLEAAAARYDGRPHVAFIEIGSLGNWGEGHTYHAPGCPPISHETKCRHIDLWRKHFRNTPLIVNDDYDFWEPAVKHAWDRGCGLADWSILTKGMGEKGFHSQRVAQFFWPDRPVVVENCHYRGRYKDGTWRDGSKYEAAVEMYHASYARIHGWPRVFLDGDPDDGVPGNRDLVDRINRRLGYRLQIVEASWPRAAARGETIRVSIRWRNAGVAPCYAGGRACLSLRGREGGLAFGHVDRAWNVRALRPGLSIDRAEPVDRTCPVRLPEDLAPGEYDVLFSVGDESGRPVIALPHDGDDGARRYRLGSVAVR